jgi:type IV pilus assembly protein PilW
MKQKGFSLIELMIGVALGLVILAALTSFFVSSSGTRNEIERTSRQIENGRYAMNAIRDEIHLAGFYAELITSSTTWGIPDPCVTTLAGQGFTLGPPQATPLPITGYAVGIPKPSCITNRVLTTDVLVIRRFGTEPVPVGTQTGQDFYFQPSRCRTDSTTIPWIFDQGANQAWNTLHKLDCTASTDLYRWRVNIFYIRNYSYAPGDGIQTLVKLELDPANPAAVNGMVTYPIAEGIADMRIEYGVDNNGDGAPDEWRRCDTATPCDTTTQWPNVTAVRVHLLAVNLEPTIGYVDVKTYDMGTSAASLGPFNDPYKRHVYAGVISAPNRTGPRE